MVRRRPLLATLLAAVGLAVATSAAGALGSDPGLSQQWALAQISAPGAWAGGVVGGGAPVAIIDTGIDLAHEDLRDQIDAAVTCVDTGGDPAKCKVGGADIMGHGTHVAGIAAAAANDTGVSGVAPGARLIAVRVFTASESTDLLSGQTSTDYSATTDDINAGLRWVIGNVARKGAINLSLGGALPVRLGKSGFEEGIEDAWAAGWVPVVAAGNGGDFFGLNGEQYGQLNAVVVGASGPGDTLASYSSPIGNAKWGLVAPGGDAASAGDKSACENEPSKCILSTYRGGGYALLQGTSMATPHVAGAVALVMGTGQDNRQAVERILATADPKVSCGRGCRGRLDVAKATSGLASAPAGPGAASAPTAASAASDAPAVAGVPAEAPGGPAPAPTTTAQARNAGPVEAVVPDDVPVAVADPGVAPIEAVAPPSDDGAMAISGVLDADDAGRGDDDPLPPAAPAAAGLALLGVVAASVLTLRRGVAPAR